MKTNQILFATDFSESDQKAYRQSCRLALDWNAGLHILYVKDPREPAKAVSQQVDPADELKKYIPNDCAIDFKHAVREGEPAQEILQYSEDNSVSLIVLGTHGRMGLERFVVGSVAEKVLRNAKCAVMTIRNVKNESKERKLKKILVPVDFSVYGYAAVDFASRLAIETDAAITICYVDNTDSTATESHPHGSPDNTESQQVLSKQLDKFQPTNSKIKCNHKLFKGNPASEICDYAKFHSYDYIVLGTHGRSGLARAVMGSVTELVVRNSTCPVVTVKPSNERIHLVA